MRASRCRLELEREVLPSSAVEDVDLPIVPFVHRSPCTFGKRGRSRLLLHRYGRHGCRHNVRDGSDVVGSEDHGCREGHCFALSQARRYHVSPFSLEPNVERVTAECQRRRRLGLTVTPACAPSYTPTTSFKLLACHCHGDWALPCMARASSFLTSVEQGQEDITHSTRVLSPAGRNVAASPQEYEFNVLTGSGRRTHAICVSFRKRCHVSVQAAAEDHPRYGFLKRQ